MNIIDQNAGRSQKTHSFRLPVCWLARTQTSDYKLETPSYSIAFNFA